jgi:hypothetical protein
MLKKLSESFRKRPVTYESSSFDIALSIDGHANKSQEPTYYIGESITGVVELEVKTPIVQVLAITVHLVGREILENATDDQFLFLNTLVKSISSFIELEQGDYTYPFSFKIPSWCPASTQVEQAAIKYEVVLSFKFTSTSPGEVVSPIYERKMSLKHSHQHTCETVVPCLDCCGKIYKIISVNILKHADKASVDYPSPALISRQNCKFLLSKGHLDYSISCSRALVKNEDHWIQLSFKNSSFISIDAISMRLLQTISTRNTSNESEAEIFFIKKQKFKVSIKRNEKTLLLHWRVPNNISNSVFYGPLSQDDLSVQKVDDRYPCQNNFPHLTETPNLTHAQCSDGGGVLFSVGYQLVLKFKPVMAKSFVETIDVMMYDHTEAKSTAIVPLKNRQVSPSPLKLNEMHQDELGSTELL